MSAVRKHKACAECYCVGGHASFCRTKGYQFESAPAEPPAGDPHAHLGPAPEGLCCGESRSRAGCEYHDPRLQPKPEKKHRPYECDAQIAFRGTPLTSIPTAHAPAVRAAIDASDAAAAIEYAVEQVEKATDKMIGEPLPLRSIQRKVLGELVGHVHDEVSVDLEASPMKPGLTEPPSYDEMVKQLTARWYRSAPVSGDLCRSLKGNYFYRNAPQAAPPRAPTLRGEPVAIGDDGQIRVVDPPYAARYEYPTWIRERQPPTRKKQTLKIPRATLVAAVEAGLDLKLTIRRSPNGNDISVEYSFE